MMHVYLFVYLCIAFDQISCPHAHTGASHGVLKVIKGFWFNVSFPTYQKNLCSFLFQYSTDVIYQIGKKKLLKCPYLGGRLKIFKILWKSVCKWYHLQAPLKIPAQWLM